jgi:NH3-dependent NAD+ synthetase
MKLFNDRVQRLSSKIEMSKTPVPGFILGLSGTDSIIAFLICYEALKQHGLAHRLYGVHYAKNWDASWFAKSVMFWLHERCPEAFLETAIPLGGNQDQQRWADLHLRALNTFGLPINANVRPKARDPEDTYWIAGTINATEYMLGRYSVLADTASVQPLRTLFKSDILDLCIEMKVPDIAMEYAQIPDCICGRDELAANNIRVIDDILRFRLDPTQHDPELLQKLYEYIAESKRSYDFKQHIPYII